MNSLHNLLADKKKQVIVNRYACHYDTLKSESFVSPSSNENSCLSYHKTLDRVYDFNKNFLGYYIYTSTLYSSLIDFTATHDLEVFFDEREALEYYQKITCAYEFA